MDSPQPEDHRLRCYYQCFLKNMSYVHKGKQQSCAGILCSGQHQNAGIQPEKEHGSERCNKGFIGVSSTKMCLKMGRSQILTIHSMHMILPTLPVRNRPIWTGNAIVTAERLLLLLLDMVTREAVGVAHSMGQHLAKKQEIHFLPSHYFP